MDERVNISDLVQKGQRLRSLLSELRAEAQRLKDENDSRWEQNKTVLQSLRDDPSAETARAYTRHIDWINSSEDYDRRHQIDERRQGILKELREIQSAVCAAYGIGTTEDDWSRP